MKATLTVAADNKGRPFNTANPALTYTTSGFVNGDTVSVLSGAPSLNTTATQSCPVGDYPITITPGTFTASDYSFSFVNGTLSVGKTIPVINWSNPANIIYGTALTNTQLNAAATDPTTSATVAGTFTYSPVVGTVLHVGNSQTLAVNFAPSDTSNYAAPSQKTVSINVTKATLTIAADSKSKTYLAANPTLTSTPSGFVNGDTASVLSGAPSLSTTATGTSTVNSYSITVSQGTLSATDYNFNFTNGTLSVTKATPVISWSNPADITFGTALSATQLNAVATNPNDGSTVNAGATSNYSPASAAVLNAGNNQVLAFNFVPADTANYNTPAQKTVSINVLKSDQTITFNPTLANKVVGNAPFAVNPTASSGLTVTLSILSGPATISGNTVTITGAGPVTVHAVQGGNGNFNATSTDQSFIVTSAPGLTPITGRFVFTFNFLGTLPINISNADGTFISFNIARGQGPGWSPDGTKIVFTKVWSGANAHLSVMNADGSNQLRLDTNETDRELDTNPAWSPDGKSIAYDCDFSGAGTANIICVRKLTDFWWTQVQETTQPIKNIGNVGRPAWSPDNKKLVFSATDLTSGGSFRVLYIYDLAAKTFTRLSNAIGTGDMTPNWSSDGTKIVFRGFNSLSVINADGSNKRDIPSTGLERSPKWSLDMKQIAFIDQDPSDSSKGFIKVMNADGTTRTQVYAANAPILSLDWQLAPINVTTPIGAGSSVTDGPVNLTFSNVGTGGTTSVIPITPGSAGSLPGGFAIDGNSLAFDVTTTASYTAPVEVCFNVPSLTGETAGQFNARKVMHGENGVLVDRTSRHDFAAHLICANVNSLSPFAITTSLNPTTTNEIDDPTRFTQQHYLDFLSRQPDTSGVNFWTGTVTSCGTNQSCIDVKRINESAAFFLSIEFQQEGYLVERTYKAAYGDASGTSTFNGIHQLPVPIVRLNQFLDDAAEIGQGVVVNQGNWQQQLDSNKNAFMLDFVQRQGFMDAYPTTLTPSQFVNQLFANVGITPSSTDSSTAIGRFGGAPTSADPTARAKALRDVSENSAFVNSEMNRAFVLMQYFGYLRRNPNEGPDSDYTGYDFWLTKLNQFNGNFTNAEMVKAFITSAEYRHRFGPN